MAFGSLATAWLLVHLVYTQKPPACVEKISKDPGYMECMYGFWSFVQNAGESASPATPGSKNGEEMMKLMCSDEGKAAMRCTFDYFKNCPELTKEAGWMDFSSVMQQGGIDAACSILVGPCSTVQQCIVRDDKVEKVGGRNNIPRIGANPIQNLILRTSMICGRVKMQYDCIMEHVDKCPEHVQKIEETLKIFIELAVKGDYPLASYDVMKKFMAKECEKMPPEMEQDRCLMTALSSPEYGKCLRNATDIYAKKNDDLCAMYDLQSICLDDYVSECGEEKTNFIKNNMHLILNSVPAKCAQGDTSTANRNVQLVISTVIMLGVSLFLVF